MADKKEKKEFRGTEEDRILMRALVDYYMDSFRSAPYVSHIRDDIMLERLQKQEPVEEVKVKKRRLK